MISDPEESVRLQGYGEMTLRSAIATLMVLSPNERADAAVYRVRDGSRLASSEIAELAADWGISPAGGARPPKRMPEQHWQNIVRGMVREAPLPSLLVAFLMGVLVARR